MEQSYKPTLCVDFDGVLHSYTSGWKGISVIPDPPVEGAIKWLVDAVLSDRVEICIYSSRSKEERGIEAMKGWLEYRILEHFDVDLGWTAAWADGTEAKAKDVLARLKFPTQKPAAQVTIDDRAHGFVGVFWTVDEYLSFCPHTKMNPLQKATVRVADTVLRHTHAGSQAVTHAVADDPTHVMYIREDKSGQKEFDIFRNMESFEMFIWRHCMSGSFSPVPIADLRAVANMINDPQMYTFEQAFEHLRSLLADEHIHIHYELRVPR